MAMCVKARVAPARILMPVAFASSLGGTVTLVGTPPNGIINAMLGEAMKTNPDLLLRQFGFFEYGRIGIPLLIAGWIWFPLIGYKLLPKRNRYYQRQWQELTAFLLSEFTFCFLQVFRQQAC